MGRDRTVDPLLISTGKKKPHKYKGEKMKKKKKSSASLYQTAITTENPITNNRLLLYSTLPHSTLLSAAPLHYRVLSRSATTTTAIIGCRLQRTSFPLHESLLQSEKHAQKWPPRRRRPLVRHSRPPLYFCSHWSPSCPQACTRPWPPLYLSRV